MEMNNIVMGFLLDIDDARVVMHVGIANPRYPLKSAAGKTFPAFPAHAQPVILRIWLEAHGKCIDVICMSFLMISKYWFNSCRPSNA